jgi:type IV pilus assembly protein PilN
MTQIGSKLILKGRAQSNARVSTYMRNIESSPWLNAPQLRIIENKDSPNRANDDNTFQLELVQVVPKEDAGQ